MIMRTIEKQLPTYVPSIPHLSNEDVRDFKYIEYMDWINSMYSILMKNWLSLSSV